MKDQPLRFCGLLTNELVLTLAHFFSLPKIVQRLGGVMTDRAGECTHIVATRITRTVKFLCGISVCEHVVTPEWVEESERRMRFVEEAEFSLCDRDAEETFGMDLAASLARAKEKKLLEVGSGVRGQLNSKPKDLFSEHYFCSLLGFGGAGYIIQLFSQRY